MQQNEKYWLVRTRMLLMKVWWTVFWLCTPMHRDLRLTNIFRVKSCSDRRIFSEVGILSISIHICTFKFIVLYVCFAKFRCQRFCCLSKILTTFYVSLGLEAKTMWSRCYFSSVQNIIRNSIASENLIFLLIQAQTRSLKLAQKSERLFYLFLFKLKLVVILPFHIIRNLNNQSEKNEQ